MKGWRLTLSGRRQSSQYWQPNAGRPAGKSGGNHRGGDLCRTTKVCKGGREKQLLVLAEEEEYELGARRCQGCHPSTTSRCTEVKEAKHEWLMVPSWRPHRQRCGRQKCLLSRLSACTATYIGKNLQTCKNFSTTAVTLSCWWPCFSPFLPIDHRGQEAWAHEGSHGNEL